MRMHLNADISSALQLLEDIKQTVDELSDPKIQVNTYQDLCLLIPVLENPIFQSVVTVQDSLCELNHQLDQYPSILQYYSIRGVGLECPFFRRTI